MITRSTAPPTLPATIATVGVESEPTVNPDGFGVGDPIAVGAEEGASGGTDGDRVGADTTGDIVGGDSAPAVVGVPAVLAVGCGAGVREGGADGASTPVDADVG
jgi:hypothetical protein